MMETPGGTDTAYDAMNTAFDLEGKGVRVEHHTHHHSDTSAWNTGMIRIYVLPESWCAWLIGSVAAVAMTALMVFG